MITSLKISPSFMKILKGVLVVITFLCCLQSSGQQYLYLVKKGDTPYKRLGINEPLYIKTTEDGAWVKGLIKEISTESITVGKVTYPFSEIEAMRTYSSLLKTTGYALGIGGVMFTGIAAFNATINNERPILYPVQIVTGVLLLSGGYIAYLSSRKTYKKDKGWQYKVIDLNE